MRLIRLLILLLIASPAFGTIGFVQAKGANASGANNITVTPTSAITAGNGVIAMVGETTDTTQTFTVADSLSEAYTQIGCGYEAYGTTVTTMSLFWLPNSGAATWVKATFSGGTANMRIVIMEFSGLALSNLEDGTCAKAVDGSGSATALTSGAYTGASASSVLIYCVFTSGNPGGFTQGTGYTYTTATMSAGNNFGCEYKIATGVQTGVTASMSWVNGMTVSSILAGFKAPAPATGKGYPRIL